MSKKPLRSFTVKVSKWRCGGSSPTSPPSRRTKQSCGTGAGHTSLLNEQGFKCCLGFACQAAGYKGKLVGKGLPDDLEYAINGLTERVENDRFERVLENTTFTSQAMMINDCPETTVKQKQTRLINLGKRHKIKIKFVE